jgi:hypothetical protein
MSIAQQGVYWPFKTLLQGAGITLTEDPTSIRIATTGAGPGGGDMLSSVYATNGAPGVVDKAVVAEGLTAGANVPLAQQANSVPWNGITGAPTSFPSDWSVITSKPATFPPSLHAPTHAPTGSDPIALADATKPGFLAQLTGTVSDYVGGDNACHALAPEVALVVPPAIWATRLRSFNAIGNPNGEVSQRRAAGAITITSGKIFLEDRWQMGTCASTSLTGQRVSAGTIPGTGIILPGTSFKLSNGFFRLTLGGTKTTLAASDWMGFQQTIEGPMMRELASDVHSLSLLVRTSVPNLTIAVALQDPGGTRSLVNTYKIQAANTLTLIQLPNLAWPGSGGNFSDAPGVAGYQLYVTVAAGSNFWGPSGSEGVWQNGNFIGSNLQSNFAYGPVGSTFDLCFLQHEPGAQCSTFIDKPFDSNYHECLRYFCKSYDYDAAPGTTGVGELYGLIYYEWADSVRQLPNFPRPMAKVPAVIAYNPNTGNANHVSVLGATSALITTYADVSKSNLGVFLLNVTQNMPNPNTAIPALFQYIADTGW